MNKMLRQEENLHISVMNIVPYLSELKLFKSFNFKSSQGIAGMELPFQSFLSSGVLKFGLARSSFGSQEIKNP